MINDKHDGGSTGRKAPVTPSREGRSFPFHPFLLAAASVLALFANNMKEAALVDILPSLGAVLGFALVVVLVLGALFRGFGPRTALLASIVVIGSLFYARLHFWTNQSLGGGLPYGLFLLGFFLVLGVAFVLVARTHRDLRLPHTVLNGIALIMVASPLAQVAWYKWHHARPGLVAEAGNERPAKTDDRPDIYYLIFDRYASPATLQRYYGFDDTPIVDFLQAEGFYVAPGSHANYLKTAHSIASTFQMDYLDFLADEEGHRSSDWQAIYGLLGEHRVARFLKSAGYRYAQVGSWWSPTQANAYADFNPRFGFREFDSIYVRDRALAPILGMVAPESSYARSLQWDSGQCQRVRWQIEQIKKAADGTEPTFVFGHLLLPHEPYVFDPDGNCLTEEQSRARGTRQGYLEQVQYANKVIRDLVTSLRGRDSKPPVINIQADECPFPETDVGDKRMWQDATRDELQIKMGILNAYYFPDGDYSLLYPTITPVNSFRMLFDKYFDAGLARLPDKMIGFPHVFRLYDFFDMTGAVRDIVD
jgi:hypothetical protein